MATSQTLGEATPDITHYSDKHCPWCRRVHITLSELGLPHEVVNIDIHVSRPEWYFEINPRGKVPAIKYNGTVVIESADIVKYLIDRHPSHLTQAHGVEIPRSEVDAFVDAFMGEKQASGPTPGQLFQSIMAAPDDAARDRLIQKLAVEIKQHIEPSLGNVAPYYGGSDELTLVEALCGPHLYLMATLPRGLGWNAFEAELSKEAPAFWRWMQTVAGNSTVNTGWDMETLVSLFKANIAKIRANFQRTEQKA
ncbi:thioredoxin-like protein [Thozetella sp. PMI_491]|nr:thioredoxin-like protein [Thozetella sp. PMI_491]